jgi:hypothetical protein
VIFFLYIEGVVEQFFKVKVSLNIKFLILSFNNFCENEVFLRLF